jgi:hypothetical protein
MLRDAYRGIILPWIVEGALSAAERLAPDFDARTRDLLRVCPILSITDSFNSNDFLKVNDLGGLAKPISLGEDTTAVAAHLPSTAANAKRIIVFEDFVGTGKQASNVLAEMKRSLPQAEILFLPIIIMERGLHALRDDTRLSGIKINPVLVIPYTKCITPSAKNNEDKDFSLLRTVVKGTAKRSLETLNRHDDAPTNAFGYKGSGAILVTFHNAPNNSLPLLHHKAPSWEPLFRRLHHSKDSLK